MSLLLFVVAVLFVILALLLIRKYTSLEFVGHVRLLWRTWSVRLAVLAAAVQAIAASTPQSLLDAWNTLPPDVKGTISPDFMHYISAALMVASFLAQSIRQEKLKNRADKMRGDQ